MMVKSVLVPIDFSGKSQRFVDETLKYLVKEDVPHRVVLLNTYVLPSAPYHELLKAHDDLRKKSIEGLETEMRRLKDGNAHLNISFETLVCMGSLDNVMVHVADEKKIDVIVLSTDNGLRRNPFRGVKCPILILPVP